MREPQSTLEAIFGGRWAQTPPVPQSCGCGGADSFPSLFCLCMTCNDGEVREHGPAA